MKPATETCHSNCMISANQGKIEIEFSNRMPKNVTRRKNPVKP